MSAAVEDAPLAVVLTEKHPVMRFDTNAVVLGTQDITKAAGVAGLRDGDFAHSFPAWFVARIGGGWRFATGDDLGFAHEGVLFMGVA